MLAGLALLLAAVEPGLHEAFLQSEHRTLDPEEADFFYIPIYAKCYLYPIHGVPLPRSSVALAQQQRIAIYLHSNSGLACSAGFNDAPFFHSFHSISRLHATVNMLIEAHSWVRSHLPYWDRSGGRDHIIVSACAWLNLARTKTYLLSLHHRS